MGKLRTILILGRVSNLPTVWTNVLAGWFLAGGSWAVDLIWVELGVSLLYVAGMTLNDAFDAGWDRQHAPERPIPSGAISEGAVWGVGFVQLAAGVGVLLFATEVDWPWMAGLAGMILLYDWIHKKTAWAVLAMGACRWLVYPLAASAVPEGEFMPGILVWGFGLFLYVVGITAVARSERTGARQIVRWDWRIGLLMAPLFLSLMAPWNSFGGWELASVVAGSLFFAGWIFSAERQAGKGQIGLCVSRLIAGIVLVDALALFPVSLSAIAVCLAFLPVTLLLQRYIPAT